jgi:hypothetical protein
VKPLPNSDIGQMNLFFSWNFTTYGALGPNDTPTHAINRTLAMLPACVKLET